MSKIITAGLLVVAFGTSLASNDKANYFIDGYRLVEWMNSVEPYNEGLYGGYNTAVFDLLSSIGEVCPPDPDIRSTHINMIVTTHLEANPQQWSNPASRIVSQIFMDKFPCSGE